MGIVLGIALIAGLAETYLRLFPPSDLYPYLGDSSPLTGIYRTDPDFGVGYRSWDDFAQENAIPLITRWNAEQQGDHRPTWAFFGNSFVQGPGMLADRARAGVADRRIFNLGRNEPLSLRFAQIKLLLQHGIIPERIFFVLMPVDVLGLGRQPLSSNYVTTGGAWTHRVPEEPGPLNWSMRNTRLGLIAGVRSGRIVGNPRFRSDRLYERIEEPLLGDLHRLFRNLARVTRERNVPVTVLLIPAYHQVRFGASCGFQDAIAPFLIEWGFDVCDPREILRRQPGLDELFIPDKHFSARGNAVLLDSLLGHLGRHDVAARGGAPAQ